MSDSSSTATAVEQPEKPVRIESREELEDLVEAYDRVLLEIYTTGCTLCQSMEPILGNVARATDTVVAMLNGADDLAFVDEVNVQSVPTFLRYEDGELVDRLADGFVESDRMVEFASGNAN